jgi:hypothetical protein
VDKARTLVALNQAEVLNPEWADHKVDHNLEWVDHRVVLNPGWVDHKVDLNPELSAVLVD